MMKIAGSMVFDRILVTTNSDKISNVMRKKKRPRLFLCSNRIL